MNQYVTSGIVLKRTNYGEADRIIRFLTPDHGKISVMAKGVRRSKSKLAGGIELFSESSLTVIPGRGSVSTLVSSRLIKHYGGLVEDLNRTSLGYDFVGVIDKITEDDCESAYYELLSAAFQLLNSPEVSADIARGWFFARLLVMTGHKPNLDNDTDGENLQAGLNYIFNFGEGRFQSTNTGQGVDTNTIKLVRLFFEHAPSRIAAVKGIDNLENPAAMLLEKMAHYFLHV